VRLGTHVAKCAARNRPAASASNRSRVVIAASSRNRVSAVIGTRTPDAMALRQNAIARAGAAVAAMIGPDVDTAPMATAITARSAVGGTASAADLSAALTRRVSLMDAASTDALIDEAVKKSGLIWVQAKLPRGVTKVAAQPVWHVWQDGALYVLTGGLEQPPPGGLSALRGLESPRQASVTVRGKDTNGRLVVFETDVDIVDPGSDDWDAVMPALVAGRLNAPDGEAAPQRWARECTLWRLRPTGVVSETADMPSTDSHAVPPPPTPGRSRVPRPLHLRGRPSRNRGGH
jgi:hypothetical protein